MGPRKTPDRPRGKTRFCWRYRASGGPTCIGFGRARQAAGGGATDIKAIGDAKLVRKTDCRERIEIAHRGLDHLMNEAPRSK
jgi:hypothetical protein